MTTPGPKAVGQTGLLRREWFARYHGEHEDEGKRGKLVSRRRVCGRCATEHTQHLLSPAFLEAMEARGCMALIRRQIPELYVPVMCPACERKDIAYWARVVDQPTP